MRHWYYRLCERDVRRGGGGGEFAKGQVCLTLCPSFEDVLLYGIAPKEISHLIDALGILAARIFRHCPKNREDR